MTLQAKRRGAAVLIDEDEISTLGFSPLQPSMIPEIVDLSTLLERLDELLMEFANASPEGRAAVLYEIQEIEARMRSIDRGYRH